jgi:hypothetical protein
MAGARVLGWTTRTSGAGSTMRSALLSLVLAIVLPLSLTSWTRRSGGADAGIALVEPVRVLEGPVTLRNPEGEEQLERGDVVCFPVGPEGAHKVSNQGGENARVLMISTMIEPSVAIYPDSDKLGVWPGDKRDNLIVRRGSAVDYWDGES